MLQLNTLGMFGDDAQLAVLVHRPFHGSRVDRLVKTAQAAPPRTVERARQATVPDLPPTP